MFFIQLYPLIYRLLILSTNTTSPPVGHYENCRHRAGRKKLMHIRPMELGWDWGWWGE